MLNEWLPKLTYHLVELANLPFELETHEQYLASIGWQVTREDWYPETFFEVQFEEVGRRLLALDDEPEMEIGVGLYALTCFPDTDESCVATGKEFDQVYKQVLGVVTPFIPGTPIQGTYREGTDRLTYHFAYWQFPETFLTLVQHHEGDIQSGNSATLDFRLLPRRGSDQLQFPLRTNMLF